jgi:hypothetical protein
MKFVIINEYIESTASYTTLYFFFKTGKVGQKIINLQIFKEGHLQIKHFKLI